MFLSLKNFEEYMEKYDRFWGMDTGSEVFLKEQALMERDAHHTHREKENIRERRNREVRKELHASLEALQEEINDKGVWLIPPPEENVEFCYRFPDGKKGDIDHYLAGIFYEPEEIEEGTFKVVLSGEDYRLIELLAFPAKALFTGYDHKNIHPSMSFLLKYNRIVQIEHLMYKVNCFRTEYRSLRTVPDIRLKRLLQEYHGNIQAERHEIYEKLIGAGLTNPQWVSEQKAYAIVSARFPDAKFQYQPEFLFGQRLDIFIPSKNVAIEYQGKQHYEPVEFFGGRDGQKNNQRRDIRKFMRCKANNIRVIYWDYDKPLTEEYFESEILQQIHEE